MSLFLPVDKPDIVSLFLPVDKADNTSFFLPVDKTDNAYFFLPVDKADNTSFFSPSRFCFVLFITSGNQIRSEGLNSSQKPKRKNQNEEIKTRFLAWLLQIFSPTCKYFLAFLTLKKENFKEI